MAAFKVYLICTLLVLFAAVQADNKKNAAGAKPGATGLTFATGAKPAAGGKKPNKAGGTQTRGFFTGLGGGHNPSVSGLSVAHGGGYNQGNVGFGGGFNRPHGGGFNNRPHGGFNNRPHGGFNNRPHGGFNNRPHGGFNQGGFGNTGFPGVGVGVSGGFPGVGVGVSGGFPGVGVGVTGGFHGGGAGDYVGNVHGTSSSCVNWCRKPDNSFYCCKNKYETPTNPLAAQVVKPGRCPPVRSICPNTRIKPFAGPQTCSADGGCNGYDKCCYDKCLSQHVCKPPR